MSVSRRLGKRVRNHLRTSEKQARAHDSVRTRISKILHEWHVLIFEVLDRQPTRLVSLLSKTNFAAHAVGAAITPPIFDSCRTRRVRPIIRHEIRTNWLWEFSLEEVAADGIRVRLGCRQCRGTLPTDLRIPNG